MKFSDIPSNDQAKARLRSMADSGHTPHALLLEGPAGAGKFALARAFAQYLHCPNRSGGEPCGRCPSCVQHQSFNHIDTVFSFPVLNASRNSKLCDDYIEDWRKFLTDSPFMDFETWQRMLNKPDGQPVIYVEESQEIIRKLSFTSHASDTKILLMWLPERMNQQCANKLLKMVEEPLPGTQLIFVSDNPRAILPTIYSRLQRVEVKRVPDDEVAQWLVKRWKASPDEAAVAAHLAQGNLVVAQRELKATKNQQKFLDLFMSLMRNAYTRKVGNLRKWSLDLAALGREQQMQFLRYCQRLIRENFIYNLHIPSLTYLTSSEEAFSQKFAPFINEANAESLCAVFGDAESDIAQNSNAKIVFFDVAVKVILLIKKGQ